MLVTVNVLSTEAYRLVKAIDLVEHDIEFEKISKSDGDSLHGAMDIAYYRIADLLEDAYEQNVIP